MRLGAAIAQDGDDFEAGDHALAATIDVAGREVAQQAAADLLSLGAHAQRLGHLERAVGPHADVALPVEDALVGHGDGANRHEQDESEQPTHHASNSKYSAGRNRSSRATTRSGKVAMRVLRLLTAPL